MSREELIDKICPECNRYNCNDRCCEDCDEQLNKWLDEYDKQIIRNYLNKILGMRKIIIDEYGIIHSVVKSDDLKQLRIGWFEL